MELHICLDCAVLAPVKRQFVWACPLWLSLSGRGRLQACEAVDDEVLGEVPKTYLCTQTEFWSSIAWVLLGTP